VLAMSRKADYGLLALAHLAQDTEQVASATAIAEATGAPVSFLRNILKDLATAGLVLSARGPYGGYSLARAAESISVLEAIEAIDGPAALARCCGEEDEGSPCELRERCRIRGAVLRLQEQIHDLLRETTIAGLAVGGAGERSGGTETAKPSYSRLRIRAAQRAEGGDASETDA